MQIALIILSVGLLGVIIFFAVSPKSSRLLKLAALAALGLIALSIGICGIFLIRGPGEEPDAVLFSAFQEAAEPEKKSNTPAVIVFLLVFLVVLGIITIIALRGQKKNEEAARKKTAGSRAAFDIPGPGRKSPPDDGDESFDIGFD